MQPILFVPVQAPVPVQVQCEQVPHKTISPIHPGSDILPYSGPGYSRCGTLYLIVISDGIPIVEKDSNIVASLTNAYLFRTTPKLQTFGYPPRQQLTYKTKSVIFKKVRSGLLTPTAVTSLTDLFSTH